MAGSPNVGCCLFLPKGPSSFTRSSGYHMLNYYNNDSEDAAAAVTVVVGKEREVFVVSPALLRSEPFRMLKKLIGKRAFCGDDLTFVNVDSILFEHLLWLANNNECPSLLRHNLKEIVEFYGQDS